MHSWGFQWLDKGAALAVALSHCARSDKAKQGRQRLGRAWELRTPPATLGRRVDPRFSPRRKRCTRSRGYATEIVPRRSDTKLTGSAGEHYVCAMLARFGWAASLTRDGLARTDVLAVHSVPREMIEVQVKTIRTGSWMLGKKALVLLPWVR